MDDQARTLSDATASGAAPTAAALGAAPPTSPLGLAAPEAGIRRLPEHVGPFRIVGVLGVGGMGVVYDAEQEHPHRRVALKVIRDAMLHPDGVRRFAREAEVLARLQHPGVAQVYATGVAEGPHGPQPYFAMERVTGEPLTRYAERLDRRARLELFARVCDAVHYAHQRGVIHRDLKPANVLVDAAGQPKVLDFGVARLTDADVQGAATSTAVTATGEVVGTLLYMSPEQLRADPLAIDTRTDVYALGVMLYELLAGRRPHEPPGGQLLAAAHAILAADPPALGTLDRRLRGDLETIAAKALEKDPARRYASAAGLAGDVRRHLADEPITARPASAAYQLRKLARRHRAAVAAAAVAVGALAAGAVAGTRGALRARAAERVAVAQRAGAVAALRLAEQRRGEATRAGALANRRRAEAVAERSAADSARADALRDRARAVASAAAAQAAAERARAEAAKATAVGGFLEQMLVSADPETARGRELTVREVLDSAARRVHAPAGPLAGQPAVRAAALRTLAESYRGLGAYPAAAAAAESSAAILARTPGASLLDRARVGQLHGEMLSASGERPRAAARIAEALALARRVRPADPDLEAGLLSDLGVAAYFRGDVRASDSLLDAAVALARRHHRRPDAFLALRLRVRAEVYSYTNRTAAAVPLLRDVLAITRREHGGLHPDVAVALNSLAGTLSNAGDFDEAERLLRESLALARRLYGAGPHPATANTLDRLGAVLRSKRRLAEAEPVLREGLAMRVATLGAGHNDVQLARVNVAGVLADRGRYAAAESLYAAALAGRRALYGPAHGAVGASLLDLGRLALRRGDLAAAERVLGQSVETFARWNDVGIGAQARLALAQALFRGGRVDEAERAVAAARAALRGTPSSRTLGIVRALQGAAHAAADAGRRAAADTLAAEALAMQRGLVAPGQPAVADALATLAAVRARTGDTTGVAALVREAEGVRAAWPPAGAAGEAAAALRLLALGEALCVLGRGPEGAAMLGRGLAGFGDAPSSELGPRVRRTLARCGAATSAAGAP